MQIFFGSPVFLRGRGFKTNRIKTKERKAKTFRSFVVEVTGLEPTTSWSLTKRATKLRYTSTLPFNIPLSDASAPYCRPEKQHNLLYMILRKSKSF